MTDAQTLARSSCTSQTPAPHAPLYYVIGASGAGKDSVLSNLRTQMQPVDRILFAHRYITRPADAGGENHVALSAAEFERRREAGLFCLWWESHGLCYGIGSEVLHWLAAGHAVVMNGSRAYLDAASARIPSLVPVLIHVDPGVLRQRLTQRGRETAHEIEQRLQRAGEFDVRHPRLLTIDNNGALEAASGHLLARIRKDLEALVDRP